MNTVELLDQAIDLAKRLGYLIRQDFFAGCGGGGCEVKGRRLLFLDLDLLPEEQLEQVIAALRSEPAAATLPVSHELGELLKVRKIA
jgi:hypothetical protein